METNGKKIGSVLVVGGGIAGMQAALDCANSGYRVYLLEKEPAIGGHMARLDKTFPTNDCAMCMISPKLVEVGRHLNIEILSYSDLRKVEGQAGDFTATILRRARFVDEKTCTGCGECEKVCPVSVRDTFNGQLRDRKAIYRLYPQAIPNVFTIDKEALDPPCRATCPAGVNAQGYVALIAQGRFLEALDVVRDRMPFAGICGRICHHPCEAKCNRCQIDEPVAVRHLKRFVADYERDLIRKGESIARPPSEIPTPEKPARTEKVAIIGGGPAGLTCGKDLAQMGYPVTVFDANQELGGMMRTGIPAYRLPRDILDHEIHLILKEGVEARTGKALGRDFTLESLRNDGYKAVFIATGAQLAREAPLQGSDAQGVLYGIPFLRDVNQGTPPPLGEEVVVIGGGNVAMDVARSALRLVQDGKVSVYYRRTREEMPAYEWEITEGEEEGLEVNTSWTPVRVIQEGGRVRAVEFARSASAKAGDRTTGLQVDETETTVVPADTVILAIGQKIDFSFLGEAIQVEGGAIRTDPLTLETSVPGIFAGGDNVLGPASLVDVVAQGHRAAESIHRFLRGQDLRAGREPPERPSQTAGIPAMASIRPSLRRDMPLADLGTRTSTFEPIELGFSAEEAVAEAQRCLNCGICSQCQQCVRVCKAHAVNHAMQDAERQVHVGAIILTNGYEAFDARRKSEYGFGRYPNVVTSLQFERILSASGPYEGHLRRPSDGKTPRKIAWIQCVGSRDVSIGNPYCSSVCCMYATKQAILAKEHEKEVETSIFFIDVRAFGKGFESFYNRSKENYGVRYVRSQVSSLKENPENQNLVVRYTGQGNGKRIVEEEFDLVVLSVGLTAHASARPLLEKCGVEPDRFGFVQARPFLPVASGRDGVYVCGVSGGPKDIPETVMEGSAAAALCGQLLSSVRGAEVRAKEYPAEKSVQGESPRIGVFVCHCGSNIASVVDVAAVTEAVLKLPGVVHAEHTLYTCSQDTQERIKQLIREKNLNRVIVASCTPRTHEPLFQETLREAGLNKYLFEMADIREQCSWVHQQQPDQATEKAKALVRGSVAKSRLLEPLQFKKVGVTKTALIIGGGISGMTAALSLARQGFKSFIVEKSRRLGGNLHHVKHSLEGHDWQEHLRDTTQKVLNHESIKVYLNCEVDLVSGFVGNFTTKLKGESRDEIKHGVIVVATGAEEHRPATFLLGKNPNVITQRDLETRIEGDFPARKVVMIQCVGSRDKDHPYCSRICCGEAVKNAIAIKRRHPQTEVTILYRDIRTYAFREEYYRQARELGVRFIHFPDEQYPQVSDAAGPLSVAVYDTLLGETLTLAPDLLVLSVATVANSENNRRIADLLKLALNPDGFFMEAHVKLRPVDFANEGIFLCGLAHSPKYTEENVTQALAAAGRAACILAKDWLEVGGVVAHVDSDKCASCLTCVRECAYHAPFINASGKAEIEEAKCQGCGNCAAACPAKAIALRTFTDGQERALFRSILFEEPVEAN